MQWGQAIECRSTDKRLTAARLFGLTGWARAGRGFFLGWGRMRFPLIPFALPLPLLSAFFSFGFSCIHCAQERSIPLNIQAPKADKTKEYDVPLRSPQQQRQARLLALPDWSPELDASA